MAALQWDKTGERFYELGTRKGVLYPKDTTGNYPKGYAWNGLTAVTESPSGAEASDMYADDIKYASLRSAETFGATIEAYTFPDEFIPCDGGAVIDKAPGLTVGQQSRNPFGFSYVTQIGNDNSIDATDYKLHLIYNATASPSEKSYATINDSPEAITFSWEVETTPIAMNGYKPVSTLTIDSRKANKAGLKALEDVLYGTGDAEPRLPLPDEVVTLLGKTA